MTVLNAATFNHFNKYISFMRRASLISLLGPIPVPQSDFEIEINSSGQETGGQELSLPSTSITIPIEPRV